MNPHDTHNLSYTRPVETFIDKVMIPLLLIFTLLLAYTVVTWNDDQFAVSNQVPYPCGKIGNTTFYCYR